MKVEKCYCDRCDTEIEDGIEETFDIINISRGTEIKIDLCWECFEKFMEYLGKNYNEKPEDWRTIEK